MRPELKINPGLAQWGLQALGRLFLTFSIVSALLIFQGGRERWDNPIYQVALDTPGAPYSWGAFLLVASVFGIAMSLCGRNRLTAWAYFACSLWHVALALSIGLAALANPMVSRLGGVAFITLAIAFTVIGVIYYQSTWVTSLEREHAASLERERKT